MTEVAFLTLLSALCFHESAHKATAINITDGHSASYGYCQVKLSTAKWLGFKGNVSQLWLDKKTNLLYAAKYLRYQLKRYNGDVVKAVAAYNAGSVKGKVRNHKYVNLVFLALKEGR